MTNKTAATKAKTPPATKARSKAKSKAKPPAKPEVVPPPAPQAQAPEGGAGFMRELGPLLLSPENREAVEKLSMNLARAALTAQGAIAEATLRQADKAGAMTADPFNAGPAMSEVMGRLAAQPDRLMQDQADLCSR